MPNYREYGLTGLPRMAWPDGPADIVVFHDFITDNELGNFTATGAAAGGTANSTVEDAEGGKFRIGCTAGTASFGGIFHYDSEFFKFSANRRYMLAFRGTPSSSTLGKFLMGLCITSADPLVTAPTDGVYFRNDDGDANIDGVIAKDTTTSDTFTAGTTWTAGTQATYAIMIEVGGAVTDNKIQFFKDGVLIYEKNGSAELVDNEELTLLLAGTNASGGSGPHYFEMDWLLFVCDRAA